MYCEFYGFKEQPFAITPNPRFIFLSKNHKEAFAHLLYGIESHSGFIELTGEVGSGKTTILRSLLGQLDDTKHRTALIFNPRLSADELLRTINREFGILSTGTIDELMFALNQFLLQENASSRTVVLVIDESQNLDPIVLEQIRMISNLETDTDKLIQIVLAGQPELGKMLESENLRQLNQRIKVRFHLPPLDFDDMISYINHRLEIAGGWKAATFTHRSLKKIFKQSKGLPRLINVLCDRALLIGFTEERREISPKMVDIAIRELRRENITTSSHPFIWQACSALLITTALVAVGYIAGQHHTADSKQASAQAATGVQPQRPVTELLLNDVKQASEIDCAIQSFNEVAKLWKLKPVVEYGGKAVKHGLEIVAARRGMNLLNMTGAKPLDLVKADAPCLLELKFPGINGTRYIALKGIKEGNFLIVSPLSKKVISFTESELKSNWSGNVYLPWRNSLNLPISIHMGSSSPEIKTLQIMLTKAGAFKGKPTGTFDLKTRDAVKQFQTNRLIPVDGMPGSITLLHLYRASKETSEPNLSDAGRS